MARTITIHIRYEKMNLYRVFGVGSARAELDRELAGLVGPTHCPGWARGTHSLPGLDSACWSCILALEPPPARVNPARWSCYWTGKDV
ncbi:hypothetical protein Pyn_29860 [Prunus yedoensis var. nudiflora]|uniref:Uncharacterized protein n=1 Tax=Prunus yedoensis var. nudiflora TaxID=2094558 RepID=A0A314YT81_PRUYE|nr:hypothetical protein Pyn_29860 [Prunus yedoensis var. nudiflora]